MGLKTSISTSQIRSIARRSEALQAFPFVATIFMYLDQGISSHGSGLKADRIRDASFLVPLWKLSSRTQKYPMWLCNRSTTKPRAFHLSRAVTRRNLEHAHRVLVPFLPHVANRKCSFASTSLLYLNCSFHYTAIDLSPVAGALMRSSRTRCSSSLGRYA